MSSSSHRSSRMIRARIWLVLIWILLRVLDGAVIFGVEMPTNGKQRVIGAVLVGIVWSTTWLVAIGMRQNWARYILVINLLVGAVFDIAFLQSVFALPPTFTIVFVMNMGGKFVVALLLICLPDIKNLTERVYY